MKFENCPRCLGDWEVIGEPKLCGNCGIVYFEDDFIRLTFDDNSEIEWNFDERVKTECTYSYAFDPDHDSHDKYNIKLPWLPFDITEEQLKVYLTFS